MDASLVKDADSVVAWSRLVLRGPDAVSFLDGQWSQVVPDDGGAPVDGALLHPDGTVVSAPRAERLAGDAVALDVPSESADATESRLRRFRLRVAVDFEWAQCPSPPYATRGAQVDLGAPGASEFAVGAVPQAFGDQFVSTRVSFTKGCFTGQELVGRLDARGGSAPFRLVRLRVPTLEALGAWEESWQTEAQRRSQITTVVRSDTGVSALALVHRTVSLEDVGGTGEWL
jgi:folate-binding Fe-S cluster repair protein YgfZ